MLLRHYLKTFPSIVPTPRPYHRNPFHRTLTSISSSNPFSQFASCKAQNRPITFSSTTPSDEDSITKCPNHKEMGETEGGKKKSFWAAVTLIIGTAVGPGMLGLPSATIKSGPIPSTIAIIISWVYVISSIVLVAELSFAAMEEDGVEEVSFTALATKTLGPNFGAFVAVVYACLSFSLLIACVSGIGSLIVQRFPLINPIVAHALAPCFVGIVIGFFPFNAIDMTNRLLCVLMLFSITALVAIGLSVGRSNLLGSLAYASWRPEVILQAIPVTVLTLGFHVITPFVCKLVGNSMFDARKAILFGGAVPLAMVLSWNVVVLGLARISDMTYGDPIKLLLSVNSFALPAVQGFAFSALATSLIGYAVTFPKQLADTVKLIVQRFDMEEMKGSPVVVFPTGSFKSSCKGGCVGSAVYSRGKKGTFGQASFARLKSQILSNDLNEEVTVEAFDAGSAEDISIESTNGSFLSDASASLSSIPLMWPVLGIPVFIASFYPAAFSKALDFAGVYANCFLFGVLPPAMAWIHRSRKKYGVSTSSEDLLPGGRGALLLLFATAVTLGFWH